MTNAPVLKPRYWRERAAEAREAAKDVHPANRKILEDVAQSYEEMADLMEKHERRSASAAHHAPPPIPVVRCQPLGAFARTCSSIQR